MLGIAGGCGPLLCSALQIISAAADPTAARPSIPSSPQHFHNRRSSFLCSVADEFSHISCDRSLLRLRRLLLRVGVGIREAPLSLATDRWPSTNPDDFFFFQTPHPPRHFYGSLHFRWLYNRARREFIIVRFIYHRASRPKRNWLQKNGIFWFRFYKRLEDNFKFIPMLTPSTFIIKKRRHESHFQLQFNYIFT